MVSSKAIKGYSDWKTFQWISQYIYTMTLDFYIQGSFLREKGKVILIQTLLQCSKVNDMTTKTFLHLRCVPDILVIINFITNSIRQYKESLPFSYEAIHVHHCWHFYKQWIL